MVLDTQLKMQVAEDLGYEQLSTWTGMPARHTLAAGKHSGLPAQRTRFVSSSPWSSPPPYTSRPHLLDQPSDLLLPSCHAP